MTDNIDIQKYNRDFNNAPNFTQSLYRETYFLAGEDYEGWLHRITTPYENNNEHGERVRNYIRNLWFHPSTPPSTGRGLPISCYVSHIPDNREGIFNGYLEGMWLGAEGGGRGVLWSDVRGAGAVIGTKGATSSGIIPFLGISDRQTYGISQAGVRRSSETAYLHISHPDIRDFIDIRLETGDRNRRTPNLHHAVIVPDVFMEAVESLSTWELICPNTKEVVDTIDAYDLWMDILEIAKTEAGEPNILFIDNVNRALPPEYYKVGYKVHTSNICTEILQHTSHNKTAVCGLASLNLEQWDEYEDILDLVVGDVSDFLDNVLSVFLTKTAGKTGFGKARTAVIEERNIGIGTMGWHSLLQSKHIPFESPMAKGLNLKIFSAIRRASDNHQANLPKDVRCPLSVRCGTHRRNILTLATAPTMSISTLSWVTSSGIEAWMANSFVKKVGTGSFTIQNKHLQQLINKESHKHRDNINWIEEQWQLINDAQGSVQFLEWLDDYSKDVYKTAYEINPMAILSLAADRTPEIDQGQSLNIFVTNNTSYEELYTIYVTAWKQGVKTIYYLRSQPARSADNGDVGHRPIELSDDTCVACT